MIIKHIFAKINNAAHIVRKNIISQNVFIKKMHQNENAILAKNFIKHSIINILKSKRKKRIKDATKTKLMFHVMKTKNVSTTMIFSFISTLKNIITWMKKNMKRKVNKSLKKRCFNEFATFDQKRKNNMN